MGFAVECFNILAWPLFSLGYPLCASIRAIETNSDSDVQKLVTYWVCFSIISLFDHAFGNLLQWFPFWKYVKLLAICWLVMPHFDGSLYVYKHFIHPYFLVTPEVVINRFNRWKEYLLPKERFLVAAEKYIEENGAETLEKLIAKKSQLQSKFTKPYLDIEEVKAVASKEKNVESSKFAKPNLDVIKVKAVAVATDKNVESFAKPNLDVKEVKAVATSEKNVELSKGKEPTAAQKEMKTLEITEKKEVAAAKWVNKTEIIFSQTENKMCAPPDIKGITAPGRENKLPEMPVPSQKEWTCALCQVTATSESNLNSHLQGRRHRKTYEELKAQNKAAKSKGSTTSKTEDYDQPTAEPKKHNKQEGKVEAIKIDGQRCMKPKETGVDMKDSAFWCSICSIKCSGDKQMAAHHNGSKHLARVRELYAL